MTSSSAVADPSVLLLQEVASEYRAFAARLKKWKGDDRSWMDMARQRSLELSARFEELRDAWAQKKKAIADLLEETRSSLTHFAEELVDRYHALPDVQDLIVRRYEDFVASVRKSSLWRGHARPKVQSLRFPRAARSILHVVMGVGAALLYQLVLTRAQALVTLGIVLSVFAILEISRRFSRPWNDFMVDKVFGLISRPQERHHTNSSTYYLLAMCAVVLLTPKTASCLGLLVLALGDPAASLVGSRWGRGRLPNDKSLTGSAAFFMAALIGGFSYLFFLVGHLPVLSCLGIAAAVAFVGTLVEALSYKVDDNLTIPVACAVIALFWL